MALQSSGTYAFQLSNADLVLEAYDRIQLRPSALEREHMESIRRSVNLALMSWGNRGVLLFAVTQAQIPLVVAQANYSLPANCVQMLDTWYAVPGSPGTTDRLLLPMTRTEYAEIPQKSAASPPNRYWFQRDFAPSFTTWPVYDGSQGAAVINYFYLSQLQDANLLGSEAPNVVNRYLDALIADVTARVAEKYAPDQWANKVVAAKVAWDEAAAEDREQGPVTFRPNFSRYRRGS